MSSGCKKEHCRTNFDEHAKLIRKLNDDIASLEVDIKEKDEFVHKIVKVKNDFQSEAFSLKQKNKDLIKGNDYLVEKADSKAEELKKVQG